MTPWEFLDSVVMMDRGPEHNEAWMLQHLKLHWPGNYYVEKYTYQDTFVRYRLTFADPKEETMFRLKYS